MAELSSLLFVDTDELGRPTGLIASEDTDTLASALLPQDVKDTVEIVKVADVSSNYPGWNTVSGVSGLAPISATLEALPDQFNDLSGDVQDISGEVGSLTALGAVSAELLALPSSTSGVSSVVYNNSGTWNEASAVSSFSDISSVVYNNSGTWNESSSVSGFNDVSSVVYNNSGTWNDASSVSGFTDVSSVVYDNSSTWNDASSVSGFNDVSSVVYDNSSTWNDASGVSAIDEVSGTVYNNSGTWNDASSVSGFNDVSSVVYSNSGTWNDASSVSGFTDLSSTVYDNSSTWNDASSVSGFNDVSSVVYNNSGTWNDASGVSAIDDVSGTVYNNSGTWNDASSVSGFNDVSSVVYDNSSTWNDASSVSGFNDVSSVVYDNSSTWNDASSVSGFTDVSGNVYNNSGTWNDASSVSGFTDLSGTVYDNSSTWNDASSVSGFNDVSSVVYNNSGTWNDASGVSAINDVSGAVYNNSGTWNDASAVPTLKGVSAIVSDGSNVLSSLSGADVSSLSALSEIVEVKPDSIYKELELSAARLEFVDSAQAELSGVKSVKTRQGTPASLTIESVGGDTRILHPVGKSISIGALGSPFETSDFNTCATTWIRTYDYVDSASGNIEDVSSIVGDGSGVLSALSGISENPDYSGTTETKADILAALEGLLSVDVDTPTNIKYASSVGSVVFPGGVTFRAPQVGAASPSFSVSAPGAINLISVNGNIRYGTSSTELSNLIDTIDALSAAIAADSGGGNGDASAIKVGNTSAVPIIFSPTPVDNSILVLDTENEQFTYEKVAFQVIGDTISPLTEDLGFDFGGGTSRNFVTSGAVKTLLEFDDKSRFALGRNSVPLEISALGESNIRLEDDGTNGAYVLVKGTRATPDVDSNSQVFLQQADLSADSDTRIDIDTDINMGGATHLVGNTIGANHIACINNTGATITAGTPVYITSFVGASNKIAIAEASASVTSSMPAIGVASTDLTGGAEGYVDAFGVADGIDTQTPGFAIQDTLYVASGGGLTNVRPTASSILVQNIGIVERVATQGKIIVLGPGRTNDIPNSIDSSSVSGLGALALLDTVDTAQIEDDAVTQSKIAFQAVDSSEIAPDAIISSKIADGVVTGVKLGASSVSEAKISSGAVTETKISSGAVTGSKIQDGAVTETKIATDAITASKIRSGAVGNDEIASNAVGTDELINGAVTADKVSSDILTTGSSSQTKSGDLIVNNLKADKSIDTASWTYGDPSAVNEMPVLQGFTIKPKGYGDNGKGIEFRYDTIETGYILDEESGATYNIIEGSDPGSTRVKNFTKYTSQYTNLNTYKSAASAFEIEFSGFTISNSSNTSWKPLLLFHGGGIAASSITIQALEGDGTTWTTVFSGTPGPEQTDVIFPENYYVISTGNLKGMRFRFEGISTNMYLKMLGFTSRTSPSFAWQMLKDGGSFYGDIDGKLNGVQEWYIQQDGDTSFNTVAINGSQVVNNSGDWVGNNLDHTTDLDNVGTNTHAQIDAQLADLASVSGSYLPLATGGQVSGDIELKNSADLIFNDSAGSFPTQAGAFKWNLNNDNAQIYAEQPSNDSIDFYFKLADNSAGKTDRFVYWIDDYRGAPYDRYPLYLDGSTQYLSVPVDSGGNKQISNAVLQVDYGTSAADGNVRARNDIIVGDRDASTRHSVSAVIDSFGSVSGNIATNTTNITNLTTSSSELSAAIDAKVTLSEGNQTITGNRTVDDGNNGYFYLLDMEDTGKKSQVFLNPANPSVQVVANDTVGGNITGFTAGSTNLNLQFTGSADLRVNNAPGTAGQVLTSNGTGSAPSWQAAGGGGGGTTIELLSAGFSGTGSISTTAGALLTWDIPALNTASVGYAAGEFTIPAGINGYYCEVNAMAGGDGGNARVELNFELQKDTGGGYTTVAAADNYATRTTSQDAGGVWINFLDPTAVATGDKYKFTFRRVGGGLNHKPSATKLTMKFYSP